MKNNRKNRKFLQRKIKSTLTPIYTDPIVLKTKINESYQRWLKLLTK